MLQDNVDFQVVEIRTDQRFKSPTYVVIVTFKGSLSSQKLTAL